MSVLPLGFTSGWASGVNACAVVFLFGLVGATGVIDEVPGALQRTDVLMVAGVLFLCEAVADKIPYVDTAWDVVHTVVRPVAGAVVAALPAGHQGSLPQLTAGAIGGSTAPGTGARPGIGVLMHGGATVCWVGVLLMSGKLTPCIASR